MFIYYNNFEVVLVYEVYICGDNDTWMGIKHYIYILQAIRLIHFSEIIKE